MQSAGPFNEKLKPFSQLFPPSGQNISCMLIFTGQRWPQSSECAGSLSKPEMIALHLADVLLH